LRTCTSYALPVARRTTNRRGGWPLHFRCVSACPDHHFFVYTSKRHRSQPALARPMGPSGKSISTAPGITVANFPLATRGFRILHRQRPRPDGAYPLLSMASRRPATGRARMRRYAVCRSLRKKPMKASASSAPNSWISVAITPVHPVWWLAPMPAPLSPWKYS
jgi:hypothetical protein